MKNLHHLLLSHDCKTQKTTQTIRVLSNFEIADVVGGIRWNKDMIYHVINVPLQLLINGFRTYYNDTCSKKEGWVSWITCWSINTILPSIIGSVSCYATYHVVENRDRIQATISPPPTISPYPHED